VDVRNTVAADGIINGPAACRLSFVCIGCVQFRV
jgi:hypothetical protein